MGAARKKYTPEYKAEAVELVIGSGKPAAEIARDLGIHEATLGSWVNLAKKNCTIAEKPLPPTSAPGCESSKTRFTSYAWKEVS